MLAKDFTRACCEKGKIAAVSQAWFGKDPWTPEEAKDVGP